MINTGELKYASAYDIVEALTNDESEIEAFFDWLDGGPWSWGDTMFSLVGNNEFFSALEKFFGEEIVDRYWELLPSKDHYIKLDG